MRLIDELIESYSNNEKQSPGISFAVVKEGKCIHTESHGYGNMENKVKINSNSNFYLASVSKTFTGAAIMLLNERKQLELEDKITKYFNGLPKICDNITVQNLLNHTSGLKDYFGHFIEQGTLDNVTNDDIYNFAQGFKKLEFPTGDKFSYSNTGYTLLSMLIEKVSGQTYSEFLKENIFVPYGMKNTFVFTKEKPIIPNRVYGYKKVDKDFYCDDYSLLTSGDGGIYSNVDDLISWNNALDTNKMLSEEYKEKMFSSGRTNEGEAVNYGSGWFIENLQDKKIVHHTGGAFGFRTFLGKLLDDDLTVIFLTNCVQDPLKKVYSNIPKFLEEISNYY